MAGIRIRCNHCNKETRLAVNLTSASFKGTRFEAEVAGLDDEQVYEWFKERYNEKRLSADLQDERIQYLDGVRAMPEAVQWELNPVCPECGSKDICWFPDEPRLDMNDEPEFRKE